MTSNIEGQSSESEKFKLLPKIEKYLQLSATFTENDIKDCINYFESYIKNVNHEMPNEKILTQRSNSNVVYSSSNESAINDLVSSNTKTTSNLLECNSLKHTMNFKTANSNCLIIKNKESGFKQMITDHQNQQESTHSCTISTKKRISICDLKKKKCLFESRKLPLISGRCKEIPAIRSMKTSEHTEEESLKRKAVDYPNIKEVGSFKKSKFSDHSINYDEYENSCSSAGKTYAYKNKLFHSVRSTCKSSPQFFQRKSETRDICSDHRLARKCICDTNRRKETFELRKLPLCSGKSKQIPAIQSMEMSEHNNTECSKRKRLNFPIVNKVQSLKKSKFSNHSINYDGCKNFCTSVSLKKSKEYENKSINSSPKPSLNICPKESKIYPMIIKNVSTSEDVYFHIIQWDTTWLKVQKKTNKCPVICKLMQVKYSYRYFKEYADTYYGLNLLNIWLNMYEQWISLPTSFYARLERYGDKESYFENECHSLLSQENIPKYQDVILLAYRTVHGEKHHIFGFICSVTTESAVAPFNGSGLWKEVKFYVYTAQKILKEHDAELHIYNLCNISVEREQCLALQGFKSSFMRKIIVDPKKYAKDIETIRFPSKCSSSQLQLHLENIGTSSRNLFTLVIQPANADSVYAILKLIHILLKKRCTVLVCLRRPENCFKIAELLKTDFILAVKQSEVHIPHNLRKYTLGHRAHSMCEVNHEVAKIEIVRKSRIILTIASLTFFTDWAKTSLGSNLACIIDEAHFCTEAETALPLKFEPKIVVLFGHPERTMELHPFLQSRGYHYSLFHRLCRWKTRGS